MILNEHCSATLIYLLNYKLNMFHFRSLNKFNNFKSQFILWILKIELNDAHRAVSHSQNGILRIKRDITKSHKYVPIDICNNFFVRQEVNPKIN